MMMERILRDRIARAIKALQKAQGYVDESSRINDAHDDPDAAQALSEAREHMGAASAALSSLFPD